MSVVVIPEAGDNREDDGTLSRSRRVYISLQRVVLRVDFIHFRLQHKTLLGMRQRSPKMVVGLDYCRVSILISNIYSGDVITFDAF